MESFRAKILLVDDEESNLLVMQKILQLEAYQVTVAKQASAALSLVRKQRFDLVLTDLRMPGVTGIELLRAIRKENSNLPVVMLTAYGTVSDAVEAMKLGAIDFLSKPIRRDVLLKCVQDILSRAKIEHDSRTKLLFIGASPEIAQIKKTIRMLARTNASVLIEGESGTGKEVVAKTIHQESCREGKMVSVNCGAIPEPLLESELFGYEKGAFTGAVASKPGLFEIADKGTLFLDEIGDMPLALQVKLLRVLQDGSFFRLGATETKKVDVRVIAATNNDLKKKIAEGSFREDLYYRLNVVSLNLPPLRDRGEDIAVLAQHLLDCAKEAYGRSEAVFSKESIASIMCHTWPGNIRELKNVIERTIVMLDEAVIQPEHLGLKPAPMRKESVEPNFTMLEPEFLRFKVGTSLREIELEVIRKTLQFTQGDKAKAAEILGINQRTIYRRIPEL